MEALDGRKATKRWSFSFKYINSESTAMVPLQKTWPIATVHTRQWSVDFLVFLLGCVSGQARPHFPVEHGNHICLVLTLYLRILISHLTYRVWLLQLFQIDKMSDTRAVVAFALYVCGKVPVPRQQPVHQRKTDDILPISKHHKPPTCLFPPKDTSALFWSTDAGPPFSQETPNIPAISPLLQNQEPPPCVSPHLSLLLGPNPARPRTPTPTPPAPAPPRPPSSPPPPRPPSMLHPRRRPHKRKIHLHRLIEQLLAIGAIDRGARLLERGVFDQGVPLHPLISPDQL